MGLRHWIAALVASIALPVLSAPLFQPGQLLAGGNAPTEILPPVCWGAFVHAYSGDGTFQNPVPVGSLPEVTLCYPSDAVMVGNDVLIAAGGPIIRVSPDGTLTTFVTSYGTQGSITKIDSLTIDAYGAVYASDAEPKIYKFDSTGQLTANYPLPTLARTIDLASDNCTMFYNTFGGVLKRFDVCSNMPLPDTGLTSITTFLLLGDGRILAIVNGQAVLFSSTGQILRNYGQGNAYAIALVPGEESFWVSFATISGNQRIEQIVKMSLDTGAVLAGPTLSGNPADPLFPLGFLPPNFLMVVGSSRAAQSAVAIPALSTVALIALALFLMAIGLVGRKLG